MKPLGDGFIKLIKMIIAPVIFSTVVAGIATMGDIKDLGRIGVKTLVYFEIITTPLALVIALVVVNVLQPGAGINADPSTLDLTVGVRLRVDRASSCRRSTSSSTSFRRRSWTRSRKARSCRCCSCRCCSAWRCSTWASAGGRWSRSSTSSRRRSSAWSAMIMRLAPIGAFGAMAFTIGTYGLGTLVSLGKLMAAFYLACLLFIVAGNGRSSRASAGSASGSSSGTSRKRSSSSSEPSSSESVLPRIMAKLEQLGCARRVVALVVPTGYSMNLDGTSIYMAMASIFIAQATNTPLSLAQQLGILALLLLTSKGAAGVTGSGFVTLAATLSAIPTLPVGGLSLLIGIDRFMSEARAITNLIGNALAAVVVARWEGALDVRRMTRILDGETPADADEPGKG